MFGPRELGRRFLQAAASNAAGQMQENKERNKQNGGQLQAPRPNAGLYTQGPQFIPMPISPSFLTALPTARFINIVPESKQRAEPDRDASPTTVRDAPTVPQNSFRPMGVDSGIGVPMTLNLVEADVSAFGHTMCLPIGQKDDRRRVSYTFHMALEAMVHYNATDVIVACNTASIQKEPACDELAKFIVRENAALEQGLSVYANGSPEAQRIQELAAEIEASSTLDDPLGAQAMRDRVHEIVTPTAKRAAEFASSAMLGKAGKPEQDEYLIVVDSTEGTCKSGCYPEKISSATAKELARAGYVSNRLSGHGQPLPMYEGTETNRAGSLSPEQLGLPQGSDTRTTINAEVFEFTHKETGKKKTLLIAGRGDNAWVPAIEGNLLNSPGPDGKGTVAGALTRMARGDAAKLTYKLLPVVQAEKFERAPDLNMMCCTHYPAMKEALDAELGGGKQFLTQDVIVKEIYDAQKAKRQAGVGDVVVTPELADQPAKLEQQGPFTTAVVLGLPEIDPKTRSDKLSVLQAVADATPGVPGGTRNFSIEALGNHYPTFAAEHKALNYHDEQLQPGSHMPKSTPALASWVDADRDGFARDFQNGGERGIELWERNRHSDTPHERYDAQFKGLLFNPAPLTGKLAENTNIATNRIQQRLGLSDPGDVARNDRINDLKYRTADLADLLVRGESRGMTELGQMNHNDQQLFNAGVSIADRLLANAERAERGEAPRPIGLVTGFTVMDEDGNSLGGENDGPLGTLVLAKSALDKGTPVNLVFDSGSEAAVFAAAKALGMVAEDANPEDRPAGERGFEGSRLRDGFNVKIVEHGPETSAEQSQANVQRVWDELTTDGTDLLISVERPGPAGLDGKLVDMRGRDISAYNADLSPLFSGVGGDDRPWETIGVGDGGNEIGLGDLSGLTSEMRRPDYTPVVENGPNIAVRTRADHTILSAVSNNGAIGLTGAVAMAYAAMGGAAPSTPSESLASSIDSYKDGIDQLVADGISTDGVSKRNAASVDGRLVRRPEDAQPQALGSPTATHDDFFDAAIDALQKDIDHDREVAQTPVDAVMAEQDPRKDL